MLSEKLKFEDEQEEQPMSQQDLIQRRKEIFQEGDISIEEQAGIEEIEYRKSEKVTNLSNTEWKEREKTSAVLRTKINEIKKAFNDYKYFFSEIKDQELKDSLEAVYKCTLIIDQALDNLSLNEMAYRGTDLIDVLGNFNGGAKILKRLADPNNDTTEESPMVVAYKNKMKKMLEFMSEYENNPKKILEDIKSCRWPKETRSTQTEILSAEFKDTA